MTALDERAGESAPTDASGSLGDRWRAEPTDAPGPLGDRWRAEPTDAPGPLGDRWRAECAAAQKAVLPAGHVVVSCPAHLGMGGLGRHAEEIVHALEHGDGSSVSVYGPPTEGAPALPSDPSPPPPIALMPRPPRPTAAMPRPIAPMSLPIALIAPLTRGSAAWRHWRTSVAFDAGAARALVPGEHLIAFNGTSLSQLRAARRMGYESLSLMSANSHMRRVVRQHARAHRQYPLERPWATRLARRNLREYELADRIYLASGYAWESFVEEGFGEERLRRFPLTPHPRYRPATRRGEATVSRPGDSDTFDVVYVGSLTVNKGVPLLLDAFSRLAHTDMRLVLVGGWSSRGMRRFIEVSCARDPRIAVCPGDPLPRLQAAGVCVHAAYEDGFAYAPAEALACGAPVLVSEDTGMKELIRPGVDGLILPTGDPVALAEAIEAVYRDEILGGARRGEIGR